MTRWIIVVFWTCAGTLPALQTAQSSCLPLPSPELQVLDAQTEAQPGDAIQQATVRLAAATGQANDLLRAQLFAVLADAYTEQSQLENAHGAIQSGRAALESPKVSPDVVRLELRLDLLEDQLWIAESHSDEAVTAINKRLVYLPEASLDRACTLSVRAVAHDYLGQPDLAVGDALEAYRIAQTGPWDNAKLEAAGTLARVFSQAGLYPQAEQMNDVVIEIAKASDKTALLSTAEYERAILLVKARRFSEARAALEQSNVYATQIGDRFAVAANNATLCWALIREGNLTDAEQTCSLGDEDLTAGHRDDLETQLIGNRAHLDLERHRPAAALEKLNAIMTPALHALLPGSEPQFYWDRARALASLQRIQEANADLVRMHELEEAADTAQRNRQVAVLSAVIASEQLVATNRQLQERVDIQQIQVEREHEQRITLGVAALIISSLLAYLLWISHRHGRSLRRQQVILRSAGQSAPEAVLLLDEHRRVRFANRNVCGSGPLPVVGEPVLSALPNSLVPILGAAIEEAYRDRTVVTFTVMLDDRAGAPRYFEMCIVPALDHDRVIGATLRAIDVTEHRELERGVIDGASHERTRLSSELHEGLGQQLAGVLMLLGNAAKVVRRGLPSAAPLIDEIALYVSEGIDLTRELARSLAPVKIGMGSLTAALESLVADSKRRLRIEVDCDCQLDGIVLSDLAADHLYCICREAVTNAALHGRCAKVSIVVRVDGSSLSLSIADDGTGFAPGEHDSAGLGLKMMTYRTQLLGGGCKITARTQGGTCVTAHVPLVHVAAMARC